MEFRWAAAIALWTLLSGPVFVQVRTIGQPHTPPAKASRSDTASKPRPLDARLRHR